MNCEQARDWLLQCDDPRPSAWAGDVAGHLADCEPCRALAAKLVQLEQAWRELPVPTEAETARLAFLERAKLQVERSATPQAAAGWFARWAVAAMLLLGVGALVWTLSPTPEAYAAPVLIEKLVDWNLELAQAGDATERNRIYATHEADLKRAVARGQLSPADQELAGLLLENGSWLTANDDPIDTAERFSVVADKLIERLEVAAKGNDPTAVDRYARLQGAVTKRGLGMYLARAQESGATTGDRERRLDKVILHDAKRLNQLEELLESNPDLSRREIRKALDIPPRAGKNTGGLLFDLEMPPGPVAVGQTMSFVLRLHNQGHPLNKLHVVVTLRDNMEVTSAKGPTGHRKEGGQVIFRQLASLPRGGEAVFEINVKALRAGVMKCRAEIRAKQLGYQPLWREQSIEIVNDPA